MTTLVTIKNEENSNGDVKIRAVGTTEGTFDSVLHPGESKSVWISTSGSLFVSESWPTKKPTETNPED